MYPNPHEQVAEAKSLVESWKRRYELYSREVGRLLSENVRLRDALLSSGFSRVADDSTSYPHLALARRLGLDYGDVLSFADGLTSAQEGRPPTVWQAGACARLVGSAGAVSAITDLWKSGRPR